MAGNFKLSINELSQRLLAAEEELGTLRELVARAYEDTPRNATELLRVRRDPSYRTAYDSEPLVSVRIGAYRGGDLLFERALRSVREQTYSNLEAIVVCDGRDEETARRIAALGDPRVRSVQRPRNGPYPEERGARWRVAGTHPFNQAVALAKGSWIAPIDQDDEWSEDHLEVLLEAARASGAEVVFGVGRTLLGDGSETYFGAWPPIQGNFGWQTAIYHAGLSPFLLYDVNSHLLEEPADWNLARRMLEAGVTFEFVEKAVTNYFVDRDEAGFEWWKDREQERGAFGVGGEGG
jgi:glycosyltransferase involved in cell wall biosynthesis